MAKIKQGEPGFRYAGEGTTMTTTKYTAPVRVLKEIRSTVAIYGSQGRALQVATEILIRQKRPIKLTYFVPPPPGNGRRGRPRKGDDHNGWFRMTYKLLPRTIALIDKLTPTYGDHGKVLAACAKVLREGQGLHKG